MNVLYIHQFYSTPEEPGSTRSFELVSHLIRQGHRVTIVTGAKNYRADEALDRYRGKWIAREQDGDLVVFRVGIFFSYQKSFVTRFIAFLNFMVLSVVAGLRAGPVDVVFATSTPLTVGFPGWALSVLKRAPFVFEVRDLWPASAVAFGVLRNRFVIWLAERAEWFFYSRAVRIIGLTRGILEDLASRGIPPERLAFVSHGADVDFFKPAEKENAFRRRHALEGKFVAMFAGALGVANGLDVVIEAARLLQSETDIVFVLVGDGNNRARLQAQCEAAKLQNVLFAGLLPKSEMPTVLAAADVGLMILRDVPIARTACPNKFFDYLAAGRPVIVNFSGEAREMLERTRSGFYARDSRPEAIAEAIRYLRDHPQECEMMGARARELAVQEYARPKQTAIFEQVLLEACARRHTGSRAAPVSAPLGKAEPGQSP